MLFPQWFPALVEAPPTPYIPMTYPRERRTVTVGGVGGGGWGIRFPDFRPPGVVVCRAFDFWRLAGPAGVVVCRGIVSPTPHSPPVVTNCNIFLKEVAFGHIPNHGISLAGSISLRKCPLRHVRNRKFPPARFARRSHGGGWWGVGDTQRGHTERASSAGVVVCRAFNFLRNLPAGGVVQ